MSQHNAKFEYPQTEIKLVLRNSYIEDEYYGVDVYESKRLKIILARYGCRRSFHTLPGHITADLYPFIWKRLEQFFCIQMHKKITVHLNSLEEAIVGHSIFEEG